MPIKSCRKEAGKAETPQSPRGNFEVLIFGMTSPLEKGQAVKYRKASIPSMLQFPVTKAEETKQLKVGVKDMLLLKL